MARLARLVVPGHPHLVIQRGNNGQPVFITADDQRLYLEALREVARVHSVAVHAYGLHISEALILATPSSADGLSKTMQALGRRFVGPFNKRHSRTGTLFEGRFRATVIETAQWFWKCMVLVEGGANPMGHPPSSDGMSVALTPRTSASHHLGKLVDPLIWEHADYWGLGNTPFEREAAYKLLLERGMSAANSDAIRQACEKGWPLGSEKFVSVLSQGTSRRLVPLKRGRRPRAVQSGPN